MTEMKAAVFYGPRDFKNLRVEAPKLEPDSILVQIAACGICGSDLHWFNGTSPFLREYKLDLNKGNRGILGHEIVGKVSEVGSNVSGVEVGERVVLCPMWGCGRCQFCKVGKFNLCSQGYRLLGGTHPGGFAEYTAAPAEIAHRLPEDSPYEEATVIDQVASGVHAINIGDITVEDDVAVIGAGALGLAVVAVVKVVGVRRIIAIGKYEHSLELSRRFGASEVINVQRENVRERILELTDNQGVDVVVECVGGTAGTIEQSVDLVKKGGRIVLIGLFNEPQQVDFLKILLKEAKLLPCLGYSYHNFKNEFQTACDLVTSRKIDVTPMITHRFPLDEIERAFETASSKMLGSIKVQVTP